MLQDIHTFKHEFNGSKKDSYTDEALLAKDKFG